MELLQKLHENWFVIVMGIALLIIPSPATGIYRNIAKRLGMKLRDEQGDQLINFLRDLEAGLKEAQYENNDGKVPSEPVEEALRKIYNKEREIKNKAE